MRSRVAGTLTTNRLLIGVFAYHKPSTESLLATRKTAVEVDCHFHLTLTGTMSTREMQGSLSVEKLEEFVNDYLKEDLKDLEKHLNLRNAETTEFIQLKNMIETFKEHFPDGIKTQMDVGGNFFMQAKIPKMDRILVNIGKDVYMDFTLDEALTFIDFQLRVLNKETAVIREESIKKRAHIKLALMCIGTKKNLYNLQSD